MDLSLIKQKLADSQNKGAKREKVDYSKVYWKPTPGKHVVRILPSKFDKLNPFREVQFHYGFAKFPILSLTNWRELDPIVEFAKELRKEAAGMENKEEAKDNWEMAKKISPKTRYFIPVFVRGDEDKGARLWEVGKLNYEILLGIASDEDYGDFTDINEGFDLTITVVKEEAFGKTVNKVSSILAKPKTSPITTDAELLTKLLEDQPDILTINQRYTFDKLKDILDKWLSGDQPEETATPVSTSSEDEISEETEETPTKPTSKGKAKKSNGDKFDDLFDK